MPVCVCVCVWVYDCVCVCEIVYACHCVCCNFVVIVLVLLARFPVPWRQTLKWRGNRERLRRRRPRKKPSKKDSKWVVLLSHEHIWLTTSGSEFSLQVLVNILSHVSVLTFGVACPHSLTLNLSLLWYLYVFDFKCLSSFDTWCLSVF